MKIISTALIAAVLLTGCAFFSEHGADSTSAPFCHQISLDYVSCSPR